MSVWFRRALIRLHIRRRTQQPQVYRFPADRWHHFRVLCAAGQMEMQQLDSVVLQYSYQPTLVVIKSSVEGVRWWKVDSAAPAVDSTPQLPKRLLRPFEVTDDGQWTQGSRPAIVLENTKSLDAEVDIFFAVRDEDGAVSEGGSDI